MAARLSAHINGLSPINNPYPFTVARRSAAGKTIRYIHESRSGRSQAHRRWAYWIQTKVKTE